MSSDEPPAASPNVASCDLSEGQRLGKYSIVRRLGAGGMGTVFLAEDVELKRTVALKVLPKDRADNPTLVKRFKAEGQAAAQLHHKNIVQVYEAGEIDGYLYLALEFVDGIDLLAWLRKRGPLPVKRSIAIVRQVAEALQHAYERNIVHRDIKPSNLMVKADGTVKLTDMGLARSVDESMDTSITRAGTTVGTIDYMAPEQARNSKAADIRSDIYSLGCTWYHMLAGIPPFPDGSITNKVQSHFSAPRPDPRDHNPRIPAAVVAVMHRMMARAPEDRYRSPAELLQDLAGENLFRVDVKPDLLAALSDEASVGRRGSASPAAGEDDSDWETIFRRVREAQEEDRQEAYDFDENSGRGGRDLTPKTREVATVEPPQSKRQTQRQKPAPGKSQTPGRNSRPEKSVAAKSPLAESEKEQARPKPEKSRTPVERGSAKPARMKNPDTGLANKRTNEIDVDFLKIALVLAVVLGAGGAVWWAIHHFGQQSGQLEGPLQNPYGAAFESGSVEPGTRAAAPAEQGPGNPSEQEQVQPTNQDGRSTTPADARTKSATGQSGATPGGVPGEGPHRSLLPEWARNGWDPPDSARRPELRVVRWEADGAAEFRSFDDAVKNLPREGGIVEFHGPGPHLVRPARLSGIETLELRGHAGSRPILVVQERDLADDGVWLNVSQGRLLLDGVHVVYMRRGPPAKATATLVNLESADLLMRESSLTAIGDPGPLTCIRSSGRSPAGNHVLIETSSIRGAQITAVEAAGLSSGVVLSNALVLTEDRPALMLQSSSGSGPTRHQWLVSDSTLVCGAYGLVLVNNAGKSDPIAAELNLQRTEVLHSGKGDHGAAIRMDAWPVGKSAELSEPRPAFCRLHSDSIRLVGWQRLVDFAGRGGERIDVLDSPGWQQFWKGPLPSDSVVAAAEGPVARGETIQNLPGIKILDWLNSRSSAEAAKSRIGANSANVVVLAGPWEERVLAAAQRRQVPGPLTPSVTVSFDLRRGSSFQEFLNSSQCPDGTRVICRGAGLKQLGPAVISGKSLVIEFEQADGAPLDVQPVPDTDATAVFTLRGGTLELVNAPLSVPESKRRTYPKCLVRVEAGHLVLRNCRLTGAPDADEAAVVEWSAPGGGATSGWLINSVLAGQADLLSGDVSNAALLLDNCLLVSGRNVLRMWSEQSPAELTFTHCTISAAGVAITCESSGDRGLMVFVDETVFAPPGANGADRSAAIVDIRDDLRQRVHWWEHATGYSPEIPLLNRAMPQVADLTTDWPAQWGGEAHVANALPRSGGVVLQGIVGRVSNLNPQDFALQHGCKAASWGEDRGPIGVRVDEIGPHAARPTSQEQTPPNRPTAPPPGTQNPGF